MTPDPIRRALLAAAAAVAWAPVAAPLAAQEPPALDARGYALGDMAIGDPNAPLTVIEYASLTCPHCATFHTETFPEIRADYVDTGKVRFVFREVYFDQYGLWAAMIARCGGPDAYFGFISTFFELQREWARADDIVAELQRIGRLGGLPAERMDACLRDEQLLERLVADYQANVAADDVRSTPTFIVGDETFTGAISAEEFAAILDRKLGG
jgi:protein-disulfide isomerase